MGHNDGKIFYRHDRSEDHRGPRPEPEFYLNQPEEIRKKGYLTVTRWEELCFKVREIALYNLRRGMLSKYYLLNPATKHWKDKFDYVEIDPSDPSAENTMHSVSSLEWRGGGMCWQKKYLFLYPCALFVYQSTPCCLFHAPLDIIQPNTLAKKHSRNDTAGPRHSTYALGHEEVARVWRSCPGEAGNEKGIGDWGTMYKL